MPLVFCRQIHHVYGGNFLFGYRTNTLEEWAELMNEQIEELLICLPARRFEK